MTRRWLVAAMVPLLVLVSCGGDSDSEEAAGSSPSEGVATTAAPEATTTTTTTRTVPDRSETHRRSEPPLPEVTLVDAGAEPRSELRLQLIEGSDLSFTMEMMQNQQLHVDGRPAGPEVEMTFALDVGSTIHSVTDGIAEVGLSYDAVHLVDAGTLDPAQVNMFESTMEGLVGLTFFATLDDLGNTLAVDIPRFPAMGSAVDQLLEEFEIPSLPLPVEAVGVGARWTVESEQAPYADARMPMVTEYELVELHDDRFVVRQRSTTTVEPSVVEVGGAITEFHDGEIITEGTMTWSFDSFQPFGEHTSSGSIHFSESYGSQSVEGELFQRARISIRPLD